MTHSRVTLFSALLYLILCTNPVSATSSIEQAININKSLLNIVQESIKNSEAAIRKWNSDLKKLHSRGPRQYALITRLYTTIREIELQWVVLKRGIPGADPSLMTDVGWLQDHITLQRLAIEQARLRVKREFEEETNNISQAINSERKFIQTLRRQEKEYKLQIRYLMKKAAGGGFGAAVGVGSGLGVGIGAAVGEAETYKATCIFGSKSKIGQEIGRRPLQSNSKEGLNALIQQYCVTDQFNVSIEYGD